MSHNLVQSEITVPLVRDSRSELVERIVASPSFVKSPRLCGLLTYICTLSLEGRADEISEINIGVAVFARSPGYDPSVDGIVRSHASRLRQRLEQYFSEEGCEEPIRLSIPKGAYLPVFEPCISTVEPPVDTSDQVSAEEDDIAITAKDVTPRTTPPHLPLTIWILSLALVVACGMIAFLLVHGRNAAVHSAPIASHPLWGRFFGADQSAMVVCSDAGLTVLQVLSGHSLKLEDYLDTDYRASFRASAGVTAQALRSMVAGRYTSIVNLQIASRLSRLQGIYPAQIQMRYARDLRANDFKDSSVILLGSHQTDPWVELFEAGMNFTMQIDSNREMASVLNRSPLGDELSHYDSKGADPKQTVYAVVALRHSLGGTRPVLILEGTSMAGTEAAADFVLEDMRLLPFLNKIRRPDGSIPYFEVLLQSNSLDGNASQSKIVAYRTSQE
ncbi:hypothetical protein [Acidicapsa acidisoli]|uniref:hypothetical protein n=1 Tax=Acidicapsa acidisoli TaxID=1615681 RepID=UPI0021E0766B|nr:hypothetical protein [Acidicapsa acidisoli]